MHAAVLDLLTDYSIHDHSFDTAKGAALKQNRFCLGLWHIDMLDFSSGFECRGRITLQ